MTVLVVKYFSLERYLVVVIIVNWRNMCDVFSASRYLYNCVYALVSRLCSEPIARHYLTYLEAGWRLSIYYRYDCDIGTLGKLQLILTEIHVQKKLTHKPRETSLRMHA